VKTPIDTTALLEDPWRLIIDLPANINAVAPFYVLADILGRSQKRKKKFPDLNQ
jgi:hypothetical protein